MKPTELQYVYKKNLGFTLQQKNAFKELEKHNINVNQFIRQAIKEKLQREWKAIKEEVKRENTPF